MASHRKKDSDDEWKQFEKLVTRIERTLTPGATVKHNDRIWDHESEGWRQVDVSVRCQIGLHNVLITIECRKRGRKADVNWIDELAEKKIGIRAEKTIAVASKPLTAPAIRKARKKNIEVRVMSEISEKEIKDWTTLKDMLYEERTVKFFYAEVRLLDKVVGNQLHDDVVEAMGQHGSLAKIFIRGDAVFSPHDFITSWMESFNDKGVPGDLFEGVERNGVPKKAWIRHEFQSPEFQIKTRDGLRYITCIIIGLEMRITQSVIPVHKGFKYHKEENELAEGVQFRTSDLMPSTITVLKSESGVSISVDPSEEFAKRIGMKLDDLPDFVMRIPKGPPKDKLFSEQW
jgi:hypothetical protein